jgi:hypothetical protein
MTTPAQPPVAAQVEPAQAKAQARVLERGLVQAQALEQALAPGLVLARVPAREQDLAPVLAQE